MPTELDPTDFGSSSPPGSDDSDESGSTGSTGPDTDAGGPSSPPGGSTSDDGGGSSSGGGDDGGSFAGGGTETATSPPGDSTDDSGPSGGGSGGSTGPDPDVGEPTEPSMPSTPTPDDGGTGGGGGGSSGDGQSGPDTDVGEPTQPQMPSTPTPDDGGSSGGDKAGPETDVGEPTQPQMPSTPTPDDSGGAGTGGGGADGGGAGGVEQGPAGLTDPGLQPGPEDDSPPPTPPDDVPERVAEQRRRAVVRDVLEDPDVSGFDPQTGVVRTFPGGFVAEVVTDEGTTERRRYAFDEEAEVAFSERDRQGREEFREDVAASAAAGPTVDAERDAIETAQVIQENPELFRADRQVTEAGPAADAERDTLATYQAFQEQQERAEEIQAVADAGPAADAERDAFAIAEAIRQQSDQFGPPETAGQPAAGPRRGRVGELDRSLYPAGTDVETVGAGGPLGVTVPRDREPGVTARDIAGLPAAAAGAAVAGGQFVRDVGVDVAGALKEAAPKLLLERRGGNDPDAQPTVPEGAPGSGVVTGGGREFFDVVSRDAEAPGPGVPVRPNETEPTPSIWMGGDRPTETTPVPEGAPGAGVVRNPDETRPDVVGALESVAPELIEWQGGDRPGETIAVPQGGPGAGVGGAGAPLEMAGLEETRAQLAEGITGAGGAISDPLVGAIEERRKRGTIVVEEEFRNALDDIIVEEGETVPDDRRVERFGDSDPVVEGVRVEPTLRRASRAYSSGARDLAGGVTAGVGLQEGTAPATFVESALASGLEIGNLPAYGAAGLEAVEAGEYVAGEPVERGEQLVQAGEQAVGEFAETAAENPVAVGGALTGALATGFGVGQVASPVRYRSIEVPIRGGRTTRLRAVRVEEPPVMRWIREPVNPRGRTVVGTAGWRPTAGRPTIDLDLVDFSEVGRSSGGTFELSGELQTELLAAIARRTGGPETGERLGAIAELMEIAEGRQRSGLQLQTTEEIVREAERVPAEQAGDIAEALDDLGVTIFGSAATRAQAPGIARRPRDIDIVVDDEDVARARLGEALEGANAEVSDVFDFKVRDEKRIGAGEPIKFGRFGIDPLQTTGGTQVAAIEEELIRKAGASGFLRAPGAAGTPEFDVGPEPRRPLRTDVREKDVADAATIATGIVSQRAERAPFLAPFRRRRIRGQQASIARFMEAFEGEADFGDLGALDELVGARRGVREWLVGGPQAPAQRGQLTLVDALPTGPDVDMDGLLRRLETDDAASARRADVDADDVVSSPVRPSPGSPGVGLAPLGGGIGGPSPSPGGGGAASGGFAVVPSPSGGIVVEGSPSGGEAVSPGESPAISPSGGVQPSPTGSPMDSPDVSSPAFPGLGGSPGSPPFSPFETFSPGPPGSPGGPGSLGSPGGPGGGGGGGGGGSPGTPPPGRGLPPITGRWPDQDDTDRRRDRRTAAFGGPRADDAPFIPPGWVAETITDIALGPAPRSGLTTEERLEADLFDPFTGAAPTAAQVEGTEAQQESIAGVATALSGGLAFDFFGGGEDEDDLLGGISPL